MFRILAAILAFAIFQANGGGVANQPTVFTHVQIGGAGATVGLSSVAGTATLLSRQDQYGCYISTAGGQWRSMLTTSGMPALSVTDSTGFPITLGCDEIVGDSLTPANLWMAFNGNVYFSNNTGASFSTTCYPTQSASSSFALRGPQKGFGRSLAVDPNNSSVVYMSTPSNGLYFTKDQGATCSQISTSSIPTAGTPASNSFGAGHLIAFDTSGGTTTVGGQTRTAIVYATSYGHGVYKSTDGGVTWNIQNSSGMPTTHFYMVADNHGVLWFIDNSGSCNTLGCAWKYNGSTTWTSLNGTVGGASINVAAVAVDPNNCSSSATCHVAFALGTGAGNIAFTINGGSSWAVTTSKTVTSTDVAWTASWVTALGFFPSGATFDNSGQLYTGGEGVFFQTPPTTNGGVSAWVSKTAGIEEFETTQIVTSPGTSGALIVAGWDVGCFTLTAPYTSFPGDAQHGCASKNAGELQHAYSIDWPASANTTFVSLVDNQLGYGGGTYHSYSGISANSGSTWATFSGTTVNTNLPANIAGLNRAGCMAAASSTNFIWGPTDGSGGNVAPSYTANGGATWTAITVSGTTVTGGWPWADFENSHQCAADRVTANQFYIYNWNTGAGPDAIVSCSGASCTVASTPLINTSDRKFNPTLKAVPGQAGYLFLSVGILTSPPDNNSNSGFYYYAGNGGTAKTTIANATNVTAFGFGAAFPGHTFPAIVFVGFYNNVYGIWRSIDWDGAQTWQNIGTYPLNLPLVVMDVDGDKVTPGVFYYGTGSGVLCGALNTSQCNGTT